MIRSVTMFMCFAFSANIAFAGSPNSQEILKVFKEVCLSDNLKFGRKALRAAEKFATPLDNGSGPFYLFVDDNGYQITITTRQSCGIGASSPDQSFKPDIKALQNIAIGTPVSSEPTVEKPRADFTKYILEYKRSGRRLIYDTAAQKAKNGNNVVSYGVAVGF